MNEIIFLVILALVWLIFASLQDIKKREIANWLNFSLIIFALGFRFFLSLFSQNFNFFYQGLIGLGIFFILGNLLYYGKLFAGGDAKLMISLGTVLPFSESLIINLRIFSLFIFLFLFVGGIYGIIWSIILSLKNFSKFKQKFSDYFQVYKKRMYVLMIIGLFFMIVGFFESLFLLVGIFIFLMPYFYLYAKAVDESCMVKFVNPKFLTEGDWIYQNIKVGKKTIRAKWEGLSKEEISLLKKSGKKVRIKYGIPFAPVFLISFALLVLFYKWVLLWNAFW